MELFCLKWRERGATIPQLFARQANALTIKLRSQTWLRARELNPKAPRLMRPSGVRRCPRQLSFFGQVKMVQAAGFEPAKLTPKRTVLQTVAANRIRVTCELAKSGGVQPPSFSGATGFKPVRPTGSALSKLAVSVGFQPTVPRSTKHVCFRNRCDNALCQLTVAESRGI